MKKFKLNKLVRDKIVELNESAGVKSNYRILNNDEYLQALKAKIQEEVAEIAEADEETLLKELSDLQEVIDCMLSATGSTKKELNRKQAERRSKKGSFKKKIFIDTVEVPNDNLWVDYYFKSSDRHPEIK